ncbi:hypothetical protein C2S52_021200 [Perilla frutescens var. hirtella]|nr:hypothetical protein C2S52_021200 [Perilla frutescens var. hirtella]KAH6808165.1 hypothetical protein C2S51_029273 [Perilla frutescens var. frutescens]
MWFSDDSCISTCKEAWNRQSLQPSPTSLKRRLNDCQEPLQAWKSSHFGNVTKQLADCRKELEGLQSASNNIHTVDYQKIVEAKIQDLLCKEEVMWKQRSRINWLVEGDKNTSFFHRTANGRQKMNRISKLCMDEGMVLSSNKDIEWGFRSYFQELFAPQEEVDMVEALNAVEPAVTPDMNTRLRKPFMGKEIATALSQMHSLKAPGPDEAELLEVKCNSPVPR